MPHLCTPINVQPSSCASASEPEKEKHATAARQSQKGIDRATLTVEHTLRISCTKPFSGNPMHVLSLPLKHSLSGTMAGSKERRRRAASHAGQAPPWPLLQHLERMALVEGLDWLADEELDDEVDREGGPAAELVFAGMLFGEFFALFRLCVWVWAGAGARNEGGDSSSG